MTKEMKMVLISLGGLVVPLGSIWLPLLIKTGSLSQKSFRKKFILVAAISYIISIGLSVHETMKLIVEDPSFNSWWLIAPVIGTVLPALLFLPYCISHSRTQTGLGI